MIGASSRSPRPIRPGRLLFAGAVVVVAVVAASFAGCGGSSATCDCAPAEVTITIPADIASSVMNVGLSGPACTGVVASKTNDTNGGTTYDFTATAAGDCTIEVDKPSGTFTDTLTFIAGTDCCPGFYSSTSSTVSVPEPEDAG